MYVLAGVYRVMIQDQASSRHCPTCKLNKPLDCFKNNNPTSKSKCKECTNEHKREKRRSGHEARRRKERWREDPLYKQKQLEAINKYRKSNHGKSKRNENDRKRRNNPAISIKESLSSRIRTVLRGKLKSASTEKLTGCSYDFLITHLESLFQQGMSWDNYGLKGWHIDHITPCAAFDLALPEEQRRCFHWSNLQPLWAFDNLKKSDFVSDYQI